jgi:tRNA isopentenyl-2-thiomethyl-A-37 hydroxylase MiaE
MVSFKTIIEKFAEQGEKTGWTFIVVPREIAEQLKKGHRKSFRVKGKLDKHPIEQVALVPMGEGNFILPLKAEVRKQIGKRKGDSLTVTIEADDSPFIFDEDLMACLEDDAKAISFFKSLPPSHQKYFSKWIEGAKTVATKAKRISQTVNAMTKNQTYSEMIRSLKAEK